MEMKERLTPGITLPKDTVLFFTILFIFFSQPVSAQAEHREADNRWVETLTGKIENIDRNTPGNLGVYIKHLGSGQTIKWNADRPWYLASTVKIPVAIAILELVEEDALSLDDTLTLRETDYVDGAGDLLWSSPGTEYTIKSLMKRMIIQSDNTASDVLIRLIGQDELNRRIREHMIDDGFNPVTTLLQVRYDAYSEIHPKATQLSNIDFVRVHAERERSKRYAILVDKLQIGSNEVKAESIEKAFERYYSRNYNSGTLEAFGLLLERLINGELLSEEHTGMLIGMMEEIVTGDHRIKAGLDDGVSFAHKTGTQIERACNVGIIEPNSDNPIIIAAVVEEFGALQNAESALKQLGAAINNAGLIYRSN
jgi:beta-lactamase class A